MKLPRLWRASAVRAGTKPSGDLDLALVVSEPPAAVAGALTSNKVPGGHVPVCREVLAAGKAHGFAVSAGISNSGTGARGVRDARAFRKMVESACGRSPMLVAATGTIGPLLPLDAIGAALPAAVSALGPDASGAAQAICTTDRRPKTETVAMNNGVVITGMCKGAGMIAPRMRVSQATMLAFVLTDAAVGAARLRELLGTELDSTFNAVTVDGCESTCDTVLVAANGASGVDCEDDPRFAEAFGRVMAGLSRRIAADAEGATKVVTVTVTGAASDGDAREVCRLICESALVKSACWGGDPNWGRIAQAAGQAQCGLDPERLRIAIGPVALCVDGLQTGAEREAAAHMSGDEVAIGVDLGLGSGRARMLTCDLSPEYVRFNGEYTT